MNSLLPASPLQNHLLAALPAPVRQRLVPNLEPCALPLGKVLYEAGAHMDGLWFPTNTIVSLLYLDSDGSSTEIALIGNEGVVGVAQFLGESTSLTRAVVQSAGTALRLPMKIALAEFNRHTELMALSLRYVHSLMAQVAQTAVCNRHHTLEQQLCRWLLSSLDRSSGPELVMTQELIANIHGVRREGVTMAAGKLQKLGVIEYSRGHIRVLDRKRLEKISCECYRVVKQETDRLWPPARHPR